uniref:Uncharacterized protein n=1 Tax=Setaria viridis TaxID=4556 RepID=A0A4U6U6Q3_SETVI|nr:hypothetical protein SEVIR_6G092400v2 [Setaria viridis]
MEARPAGARRHALQLVKAIRCNGTARRQPEPVHHKDRELSFTYSPVVPKQGRCCPNFFPSFLWEFHSANTSVVKMASATGGNGDRRSSFGKGKIIVGPQDKPKKMSTLEKAMLRYLQKRHEDAVAAG